MVEILLGVDDLAQVRFALSPLQETSFSLWALRDPGEFPLHLRWSRLVRERVLGTGTPLDADLLMALVSGRRWLPDFITPRPQARMPGMAEELAAVRATAPAKAAADVLAAYAGEELPPVLRDALFTGPAALRDRIADTLEAYWRHAVEPHWPRMRAVLEADVLYRAQRLAEGGAGALFTGLHPNVHWEPGAGTGPGVLRLCPMGSYHRVDAAGRGLTLCPTLYGRKATAPIGEVPRVAYPARGVATLWETVAAPPPGALAALVGRPKAAVLAALDTPASTTELARRLGVTPSAVSQHLAVLSDAGLVTRARAGRVVLYGLSDLGARLAGGGQ